MCSFSDKCCSHASANNLLGLGCSSIPTRQGIWGHLSVRAPTDKKDHKKWGLEWGQKEVKTPPKSNPPSSPFSQWPISKHPQIKVCVPGYNENQQIQIESHNSLMQIPQFSHKTRVCHLLPIWRIWSLLHIVPWVPYSAPTLFNQASLCPYNTWQC